MPKTRLDIKHFLIANLVSVCSKRAVFSTIIRVTEILIPEVARVIKNIYTDIIKLKAPRASAPTFLEIYILKEKATNLIKNEVIVNNKPFIKKIFKRLKIITKTNIWAFFS